MQFLKADTLTEVLLGPFVDISDGYTLISTAAIGAADAALVVKHDGSSVAIGTDGTLTAVDDGYYTMTVTAAQTSDEGRLSVIVEDVSLHLPVRHDFMVVNANVYDSLYAAATTDYLQTDVLQVGGDSTSGTDFKDMVDTAYDPANNRIDANMTTINGVSAANLEQIMSNAVSFTCDATGSTSTVNTSGLSSTDDAYIGRVLIFDHDTTTAALRGQAGVITDYTGSTGLITFAASTFTTASASGDTGLIL